jgi:hypothetical protein
VRDTDRDLQTVEPAVSRAKFEREIEAFRALQRDYAARGALLVNASFPSAEFIFVAPKLTPIPVLFAVRLNFTNYDVAPPSVRLVHPLTGEALKMSEVKHAFFRRPPVPPGIPPQAVQPMNVLQGHGNDVPFFCIAGVREYHEHVAHSGDSWFLHRGRGEGTLHFIVDKLLSYGVDSITSFNVQLVPQVNGFNYQLDRIPS